LNMPRPPTRVACEPFEKTPLFFPFSNKKKKSRKNNLEHGEVADAAINHKVVHLHSFFLYDLVSAIREKQEKERLLVEGSWKVLSVCSLLKVMSGACCLSDECSLVLVFSRLSSPSLSPPSLSSSPVAPSHTPLLILLRLALYTHRHTHKDTHTDTYKRKRAPTPTPTPTQKTPAPTLSLSLSLTHTHTHTHTYR
jgi:hypothetical protein